MPEPSGPERFPFAAVGRALFPSFVLTTPSFTPLLNMNPSNRPPLLQRPKVQYTTASPIPQPLNAAHQNLFSCRQTLGFLNRLFPETLTQDGQGTSMSLTYPTVKHERAHEPHQLQPWPDPSVCKRSRPALLRFFLLPSCRTFSLVQPVFSGKMTEFCESTLGPTFQTLECSESTPRINAAFRGRGD